MPVGLRFSLMFLIAVNYGLNYRRFSSENRQLLFSENLGWRILDKDKVFQVHILPSSVVTRWVIFLHTHELPPLIIVKDMLTEDEFRRLVVKLKINSKTNEIAT